MKKLKVKIHGVIYYLFIALIATLLRKRIRSFLF